MIPSVKEAINVNQFLNPSEEDVIDRLEDLDDIVISLFGSGNALSDDDDDCNEGPLYLQ